MSLAAAFVLAAAAAQVPAAAEDDRREGPIVETARVTAEILRPAVLKDGKLIASQGAEAPRSQRQSRGGRVTYEFE